MTIFHETEYKIWTVFGPFRVSYTFYKYKYYALPPNFGSALTFRHTLDFRPPCLFLDLATSLAFSLS